MSDILTIEAAEAGVSIPVDKKALGDFISGLLGQPQTLERLIESAFSIDHTWLIHLCALVLQRINQQNAPEPLAFEAKIRYRDGVVRKVTSLSAFEHFAETQNIVSTGIKINIALLIQFPSKHVPERQELILDFETQELEVAESLFSRAGPSGQIRIEIRHTERTWADDVLRLITDELHNVQVVESRWKKRIWKQLFPFIMFLFPVVIVGTILVNTWSMLGSNDSLALKELLADRRGDLASLHEKVNLLLSRMNFKDGVKFPVTYFLAAIGITIVVFCGGFWLARSSPSFVVMSKATERYKQETLAKLKRKNLILLVSMVGSIVLGIIGNFIYDKIK